MLTSKQRAHLRSIAQNYDTIFQIGKSGIGEETVLQISNALEARELIKCRVLDTCPTRARETADALSAACRCDVVCVTGNRFVLWRPSEKHPRIEP